MATPYNAKAAGLPIVGPYEGETPENRRLRRDALRIVELGPGPRNCVGIENRQYDCYFIAMIQALLHHPRVAQYARYYHVDRRRKSDGKDNVARHEVAGGCAFCQLYEFLVHYWTREYSSVEREKVVKTKFQMILKRFNTYLLSAQGEALDKNQQHDAAEAYLQFVHWLAESGDWDTGIIAAEAAKALFTLERSRSSTCSKCNLVEIADKPEKLATMDLKFDQSNGARTWPMDLLIQSAMKDNVDKHCPRCASDTNVPFTREYKISHFPELLCVRLVLYDFTNEGTIKMLKDKVQILATLNMNAHSEVAATAKTINYELYGVVRHKGNGRSINSGHYIAHVKSDDGTWRKCDDKVIKGSNFSAATAFSATDIPYMLFYARKYGEDGRANIPQQAAEYMLPPWMKTHATRTMPEGKIIQGTQIIPPAPGPESPPRPKSPPKPGSPHKPGDPKTPDKPTKKDIPGTPMKPSPPREPGSRRSSDSSYKPGSRESSPPSIHFPTPTPSHSPQPEEVPVPVPIDYSTYKVVELKEELATREILFGNKLRKAELIDLLERNDRGEIGATQIKIVVTYKNLKVVQLKAELKRRGIAFKHKFKKEELRTLLVADDKKKRRAKQAKELAQKKADEAKKAAKPKEPAPAKDPKGQKRRAVQQPEEETNTRVTRSKRTKL